MLAHLQGERRGRAHGRVRRRLDAVDLHAALQDEAARLSQGLGASGLDDDLRERQAGRDADDAQVGRQLLLGEGGLEIRERLVGGLLAVEALDERAREGLLGLHRMLGLHRGEVGLGEQLVILQHQLVGDAHRLAEHVVGRVIEADRVAVGLRHLLLAVEADEERDGQRHLRLLTRVRLHLAAHQQVGQLVVAAELHVGLDGDGVVALE